jgi:predicted DNA binding CopG/RHH family protein
VYIQNHGIEFSSVVPVFDDPLAVTRLDPYPHEERYRTIGAALNGIVFVVHTINEMFDGEELTGSFQPDMQRHTKGKHMKKAATKQIVSQPPDDQIDLTDMPEITDWSGATRGLVSRRGLKLISIRLSAQDLAMANQLAYKKGMPYQTYIKSLLHESLVKEYRNVKL